jgi:hypothetical protein
MPIFRRTNCILSASGIVALCKRLHSTLVKSGRQLVNEIIRYFMCLQEAATEQCREPDEFRPQAYIF